MIENFSAGQWVIPSLFLAGGILVGIILKITALTRIRKVFLKNSWIIDETVVVSLGRIIIAGFVAAGLYGAVLNLALRPESIGIIRQLLTVILILLVTMYASRIAVFYLEVFSGKSGGALPGISIISNLARVLIFILGLLIVLQQLGISVAPLLAALGVGGLAVALALQDTLSNLFSGLQILISKQIRKGDYVQLESGDRGHVADITWRNTAIKGLGGSLIILPNSKLATTSFINFDLPEPGNSVLVEVGVDYASDLEKVEMITLDVARGTLRGVPGGTADFEPLVRFSRFGDSGIILTVVLRAESYVDRYIVTHEFIKRLHRRYREEGIIIPYPVRTVVMAKE